MFIFLPIWREILRILKELMKKKNSNVRLIVSILCNSDELTCSFLSLFPPSYWIIWSHLIWERNICSEVTKFNSNHLFLEIQFVFILPPDEMDRLNFGFFLFLLLLLFMVSVFSNLVYLSYDLCGKLFSAHVSSIYT